MTDTVAFDDAFATVAALRQALDDRRVGARELVDAAIARIEAGDGEINAVVVRDFARARADADAADAALAAGERRPLLGVPMTVKESFDLAGHPTTWGIEAFRGHVAATDALAIQRLKGAGAVVLGKTNVPPALADWQSHNPIYGRTRNPHDLERSPGGSSGGSAAAVAAGFVPLELGSDIGGSIRIPASFCGVYGHKPSHGLAPTRGQSLGGLAAAEPPLAVIGPLARSAADLETALRVIAGPDEGLGRSDSFRLAPARHARLSDHRVLVLAEHPSARTSGEVTAALIGLADRLSDAGARVERAEGRTPDLAAAQEVYVRMLQTVISQGQPDARPVSAHQWLADTARQETVRREWAGLFEAWDIVLAPSFGAVAFPHDDEPDWGARTLDIDGEAAPYGAQLAWPAVATFAQLPATALPVGRTPAGLPLGVQAIGPWMEDLTPLRFAALLG